MPRYEMCDCSFRPTHPKRICAFCGGLTMESADRALSNSDTDSDPVCVSNLRVWAETHKDTEWTLWRMRHGYYGSQWVEVRPEIKAMADDTRSEVYERAESLGLTGLTAIVDDLRRLEQYCILDEDDESQAEQEECQEHWAGYGRTDTVRAVSDAFEEEGINADFVDDMSADEFDKVYWDTCRECGEYPERIDSSGWDFGNEARYGRKPRLLGALVDALAPVEGPSTFAAFLDTVKGDARAVWEDWGREAGLLTA